MKNKKKLFILIIVGIILVIYGTIVVMFSNSLNNGNNNGQTPNGNQGGSSEIKEEYELLLLDNISIWKYQNSRWSSLDDYENIDERFKVYVNNSYYGIYYIRQNE